MKEVDSKVRYKGAVVETITIPIYETVDEIVNSNPASLVVDMFNRGNKVRLQGLTRNKYSTKTGKEQRRSIAFNLLTTEELVKYAGNHQGLTDFIDSDEMAVRVDEYIAANMTPTPVEADETDEVETE